MTEPAASALADSAKQTDRFFTETIVGRPLSLNLGRRDKPRAHHGLDYSPKLGARLADFWQRDLENQAWRYALPLTAPVQQRAGRWRLFLERHALRLAFVALLLMLILPVVYFALAWQTGLLDGFLNWSLR